MKHLTKWKLFEADQTTVPIEKRISQALSGKARTINIPVSGMRQVILDQPWFTIIIFKKEDEAEVSRLLDEALETIPKYHQVNKESDFPSDDHKHRHKLYSDLIYTVTGKRSLDPQYDSIIVFFANEEERAQAPQTLYHVTYSPNVEQEGIKASDTMKFRNRVYLWPDLEQAKRFTRFSFHGKKESAWIWEVDADGLDVYKDFEERSESFYVKGDIPKERCTLVEKMDI